jgi:hypothetical protein
MTDYRDDWATAKWHILHLPEVHPKPRFYTLPERALRYPRCRVTSLNIDKSAEWSLPRKKFVTTTFNREKSLELNHLEQEFFQNIFSESE